MNVDDQHASSSKEENVAQSESTPQAQPKGDDHSKSLPEKKSEEESDGKDDRNTPLPPDDRTDEEINLELTKIFEIGNLEEQIRFRDDEISILNDAVFDIKASLQVKKKRLEGLKCEINELLSVVSKMRDPFNELFFVLDNCDKKAFVRAIRP